MKETFLLAFSNINTSQRLGLGYNTQYTFAQDTRWHRKQWSLYESPRNSKLLTVCEVAGFLKLSGPQYLRKVADEMEKLQQQATDNASNK